MDLDADKTNPFVCFCEKAWARKAELSFQPVILFRKYPGPGQICSGISLSTNQDTWFFASSRGKQFSSGQRMKLLVFLRGPGKIESQDWSCSAPRPRWPGIQVYTHLGFWHILAGHRIRQTVSEQVCRFPIIEDLGPVPGSGSNGNIAYLESIKQKVPGLYLKLVCADVPGADISSLKLLFLRPAPEHIYSANLVDLFIYSPGPESSWS